MFRIDPFRFLAAVLAGWSNQRQQDALEATLVCDQWSRPLADLPRLSGIDRNDMKQQKS